MVRFQPVQTQRPCVSAVCILREIWGLPWEVDPAGIQWLMWQSSLWQLTVSPLSEKENRYVKLLSETYVFASLSCNMLISFYYASKQKCFMPLSQCTEPFSKHETKAIAPVTLSIFQSHQAKFNLVWYSTASLFYPKSVYLRTFGWGSFCPRTQ